MPRIEKHHVLFNRAAWESHPSGLSLRQEPSLLVPLERSVHQELHRNVPVVPLLSHYTLQAVRTQYDPKTPPEDALDELMLAMERAKGHRKAHKLEKDMADLAIHAIDLQRPYIA